MGPGQLAVVRHQLDPLGSEGRDESGLAERAERLEQGQIDFARCGQVAVTGDRELDCALLFFIQCDDQLVGGRVDAVRTHRQLDYIDRQAIGDFQVDFKDARAGHFIIQE